MIAATARAGLACAALLLGACSPGLLARSVGLGPTSYLEKAEALSSEGRYDEAVEAYRSHIDYRLSLDHRPDWENPYLYLLLIGDIRLRQEKLEEALRSYEEAEAKKVDLPLVSDRYRYAASWLEKRGKLQEALDVLTKYRERDPLLMDSMRDRIAKEIVRREEDRS